MIEMINKILEVVKAFTNCFAIDNVIFISDKITCVEFERIYNHLSHMGISVSPIAIGELFTFYVNG